MRARLEPALLVFLLTFAGCEKKSPTNPSAQAFLTDADLQFCVDETNRYRAVVGRAALVRNSELEAFAGAAAEHDHGTNHAHAYFLSHTVGQSAENEALQWSIAAYGSRRNVMTQALAAFWAEGPGGPHYENMTGPYTRIGCGAYVSGDLMTFVQELR